jgi:hypothetical protein
MISSSRKSEQADIGDEVMRVATKTSGVKALVAGLVLVGIGATSTTVLAAKPPAAPSVNAQSLGAAAAVVDFCSRIDPAHAGKYDKAARKLVPSVSDSDITKVRNTADYKAAYTTLSRVLGELSSTAALSNCAASL